MMGLPEGRKSFKIGLAVLIQYWRRVTDTQPASQPRCRSIYHAYYVARVKKTHLPLTNCVTYLCKCSGVAAPSPPNKKHAVPARYHSPLRLNVERVLRRLLGTDVRLTGCDRRALAVVLLVYG